MSKERVKLQSQYKQYVSKCKQIQPETYKCFEENLTIGLPINHTCALAGISEDTYYRWMKQAEEYANAPNENPNWETHFEFAMMTRRCIAEWQKAKITTSLNTRAYAPNWARDLTILERRDRQNWSRTENVNVRSGQLEPDTRYL